MSNFFSCLSDLDAFPCTLQIVNQREAASSNIFRQKEFNLQALGIGGLSEEFADIFRRAFASRVFPPHVTSK